MNTELHTCRQKPPFAKKALFLFYLSGLFSFQVANAQVLTCPDTTFVQLGIGECGTEVVFDTLPWSSSTLVSDTVYFPPSGSFLDLGENFISLAAADANGNIESCFFNVTLTEYLPASIECFQNVQLSLNGQCVREVQVSELLGVDSVGCIENYEVLRLTPAGVGLTPLISATDVGESFFMSVRHVDSTQVQCLTQVSVTGGVPPSIECPADVFIRCNEPVDSSVTGVPVLSGCFQSVTLEYFDEKTSSSCPDSVAFQIFRTWIATTPLGQKDTCVQTITGFRFGIGLVDFPDDLMSLPIQCTDTLTLAEQTSPDITGRPTFVNEPVDASIECRVTANFSDDITQLCGGSYEILREWTVVKLCPPVATRRDTQYILVVDTLAPAFTLPDTVFASLASDCADSIFIPAANILAECSLFAITIQTPWDTLETNGGWLHFPAMAGDFTLHYALTDMCGNASADSTIFHIDGGTLAGCPPNDTVDCDLYFSTLAPAIFNEDLATLASLGIPAPYGNCELTYTETDSTQVTPCGTGFLLRTMTTDEAIPQTCVQRVTIQHVSDFDVVFPPDQSICTHPDSVDLGEPIVNGVSCEQLNTLSFDEVLPGASPGCYTIRRTWSVNNACVFNGVSDLDDEELGELHFADGGDGLVEHVQIIEVNDFQDTFFPDGCEIADQYAVDGACEVSIPVPIPTLAGCAGTELFVGGALGSDLNGGATLGLGLHGVNYTAIDACGRMETCNTFFEVLDTVPPELVCRNGIIIEMSQTGLVDVWADDLIFSKEDNCGLVELSYSPDSLVLGRTFDCCDLGIQPFEVWGADQFGNSTSCESFIIVQDNLFSCTDCSEQYFGHINTIEDFAIANVEVDVASNQGFSNLQTTNINGTYLIIVESQVPETITITPTKTTNPSNGVTTFDGLLITKHILNIEPLDSPYKLIAADVNDSGAITTFDIVAMRKLILQIDDEFADVPSWRFIPAGFEFTDPQDPFADDWPESITVDGSADQFDLDFIGIKMGDVNGTANTGE